MSKEERAEKRQLLSIASQLFYITKSDLEKMKGDDMSVRDCERLMHSRRTEY